MIVYTILVDLRRFVAKRSQKIFASALSHSTICGDNIVGEFHEFSFFHFLPQWKHALNVDDCLLGILRDDPNNRKGGILHAIDNLSVTSENHDMSFNGCHSKLKRSVFIKSNYYTFLSSPSSSSSFPWGTLSLPWCLVFLVLRVLLWLWSFRKEGLRMISMRLLIVHLFNSLYVSCILMVIPENESPSSESFEKISPESLRRSNWAWCT